MEQARTYRPSETLEQWISEAHINMDDVKSCQDKGASADRCLQKNVEGGNVFEMTESQFLTLSDAASRQGCTLEDWITFHVRSAVYRARENHRVMERKRKEKKRYEFYRQIHENLVKKGDRIFQGKRKKFGERRIAPSGMVYNCWGNLVREKGKDRDSGCEVSQERKVG